MLAATLAQPTFAEPGRILGLDEVEQRLSDQRRAVRELGMAVPERVVVRDLSELRVERRWEGS